MHPSAHAVAVLDVKLGVGVHHMAVCHGEPELLGGAGLGCLGRGGDDALEFGVKADANHASALGLDARPLVQRRAVRGVATALRGGQLLKRVARRSGRLVFLNQPGAHHASDGAPRDVRVIVVVPLGEVRVRHGAIHPHVGDGIAVAVGAGAPVAGLRLARGVLASVAVGAGIGLRAVLPGLARRGSVLRHALNTGPVLVCPCAAVVQRLSVLVAVVGHGRGRARCGRGAVEPGARLADAGLPLGGELVAFLGGAFLARPVLRVEPGSMCGAALLVVGCVATSGLRRQDGPPLASTVPGPPSCPATIRSNGANSNPPSSSSAFGGTCGMP